MPNYKVYTDETIVHEVLYIVEADSPEEAEQSVRDGLFKEYTFERYNDTFTILNVEEC